MSIKKIMCVKCGDVQRLGNYKWFEIFEYETPDHQYFCYECYVELAEKACDDYAEQKEWGAEPI